MRKKFILWLLCGAPLILNAQTLIIRDHETGEPIEMATLTSNNPKVFATTNSKGQAEISAFKGAERIEIRTLGYRTEIRSYAELKAISFELALIPSSINMDGVVVSATRWNQSSNEVPAIIVSIPPREISLQNPQTAADLLGITGKVFIQKSQQGGGSPMIRGFATNRLLYTVDGVRMNTAIFRSGNLQNVINIDPFAIENSEVLFGPGSVIYGSDAIGGVISFRTLSPQFSIDSAPLITGNAIARYSSANHENTGHFNVNIGWKKWASVTSFSSWDYDNLRQGSHGPDDYLKPFYVQRQDSLDVVIYQDDPLLQIPSGYSQINLMQKVRFRPNEKWDLTYGFHYSETSPYGRYDRHNRIRNSLPRYAEWNYGPQIWMMNLLNIQHTGSNRIYDQLSIRLAQQTFKESRIDRSFNSNERNTQTEHVLAYSINLDFTKQSGSRNRIYYGLEYVLNEVDSEGKLKDISTGAISKGPSRYPLSTWQSLAAYVDDEFLINEAFTLQAGLRYNQFLLDADFSNNSAFYPFPFSSANINNGAVTGSIGGVYHPGDQWVIKTSLGTAFRSPNVDDIGKVFDSEPGSVVVPNPDLDAEYAYNFDLGIARVIRDIVKVELTGYYTILQNALVRRDLQLNGQDSIMYEGVMSRVQAIQNAAKASVYGLQAGVQVKLPAGFNFSSDLNIQDGIEELDDGSTSPSRHAAPLFGVSRFRYQAKKLNLQLYAVYQGKRDHGDLPEEEKGKTEIYALDAGGNTYAPSWYTLNIKAMYNLTETFSIGTGIENLTDQRYRPYSSGISGPGRNFIISIKASF